MLTNARTATQAGEHPSPAQGDLPNSKPPVTAPEPSPMNQSLPLFTPTSSPATSQQPGNQQQQQQQQSPLTPASAPPPQVSYLPPGKRPRDDSGSQAGEPPSKPSPGPPPIAPGEPGPQKPLISQPLGDVAQPTLSPALQSASPATALSQQALPQQWALNGAGAPPAGASLARGEPGAAPSALLAPVQPTSIPEAAGHVFSPEAPVQATPASVRRQLAHQHQNSACKTTCGTRPP